VEDAQSKRLGSWPGLWKKRELWLEETSTTKPSAQGGGAGCRQGGGGKAERWGEKAERRSRVVVRGGFGGGRQSCGGKKKSLCTRAHFGFLGVFFEKPVRETCSTRGGGAA